MDETAFVCVISPVVKLNDTCTLYLHMYIILLHPETNCDLNTKMWTKNLLEAKLIS